jgi:hypothetical protein
VSSTADAPLPPGSGELLAEAGFTGPHRFTPLSGGFNNRVYKVEGSSGPVVLKHFFHVTGNTRDRFQAEKGFYGFVHSTPLPDATPRALAWSDSHRLGLFSWVNGRKLQPADVGESAVEQALNFYLGLNLHRDLPTVRELLDGAEACFSLQAHLDCIARRIRRLEEMPVENEVDQVALRFVRESLQPAFADYVHGLALTDRQLNEKITERERVVSPSDFGFHNALCTEEGRLVFFDFEYAGWDDPAKFACDFLCQPAVPVPARLWPLCFKLLAPGRPGGADPERVKMLLPCYRLKWCCIILNEFLPRENQRREFARAVNSAEALRKKEGQLAKAQASFEKMFATAPKS